MHTWQPWGCAHCGLVILQALTYERATNNPYKQGPMIPMDSNMPDFEYLVKE